MNTTDNKNSSVRDRGNQNFNTNRSGQINEHFDDIDNVKESDTNNSEIAERGYTVRNGHNPDIPNPDENVSSYDDDLDDLDDDFHTDRDLEDNNDDIYVVELENEDLDDEDLVDEDLDEEEEDEIDELDNPSDAREDEDFNETEDVLEDIDQDEDQEEDSEYVEDDVQEENDDENYPDNDPRKF